MLGLTGILQRGDADAWKVKPQIQSKITPKDKEKKDRKSSSASGEKQMRDPQRSQPPKCYGCA